MFLHFSLAYNGPSQRPTKGMMRSVKTEYQLLACWCQCQELCSGRGGGVPRAKEPSRRGWRRHRAQCNHNYDPPPAEARSQHRMQIHKIRLWERQVGGSHFWREQPAWCGVWPQRSGRPAALETLVLPPHQGPSQSRGGAAETRQLHDCQHGVHMSIIHIFPFTWCPSPKCWSIIFLFGAQHILHNQQHFLIPWFLNPLSCISTYGTAPRNIRSTTKASKHLGMPFALFAPFAPYHPIHEDNDV